MQADSLDAYMVENEVKLMEAEKEAAEKRGMAIKDRLESRSSPPPWLQFFRRLQV